MDIYKASAEIPNHLTEVPTVLESRLRVRLQDCDAFAHLNNGAYLHYLLNAREDQLRQHYGWDLYLWSKINGAAWVIGKHEIVYRWSAQFNEPVRIRTQLMHYAEKHIAAEMVMTDDAQSHVKAVMWTTFVHVDTARYRPMPHSQELMEFFARAVAPVEQESLEARVRALEAAARPLATAQR